MVPTADVCQGALRVKDKWQHHIRRHLTECKQWNINMEQGVKTVYDVFVKQMDAQTENERLLMTLWMSVLPCATKESLLLKNDYNKEAVHLSLFYYLIPY